MKQLNNEELARKTAEELMDNTASHWYDIILSALNEAVKGKDEEITELLAALSSKGVVVACKFCHESMPPNRKDGFCSDICMEAMPRPLR